MPERHRIRKTEIRVKVTESEWKFAKDKAEYLCMTMSDMIRKFIRDGVIIKYEPFDIKELSNEINKIGVNINQIAEELLMKREEIMIKKIWII